MHFWCQRTLALSPSLPAPASAKRSDRIYNLFFVLLVVVQIRASRVFGAAGCLCCRRLPPGRYLSACWSRRLGLREKWHIQAVGSPSLVLYSGCCSLVQGVYSSVRRTHRERTTNRKRDIEFVNRRRLFESIGSISCG